MLFLLILHWRNFIYSGMDRLNIGMAVLPDPMDTRLVPTRLGLPEPDCFGFGFGFGSYFWTWKSLNLDLDLRYSEPRPNLKPETRFKHDLNPKPDKNPIQNITHTHTCIYIDTYMLNVKYIYWSIMNYQVWILTFYLILYLQYRIYICFINILFFSIIVH